MIKIYKEGKGNFFQTKLKKASKSIIRFEGKLYILKKLSTTVHQI